MKISYLIPVALIGLTACTTPCPPPEGAAPVSLQLVKDVLCIDLKPEALAAHGSCEANPSPSATTDAPCVDILPKFLAKYQECIAVTTDRIIIPAVVEPRDVIITSVSDSSLEPYSSTTTSIVDGVRSVSVTVNGVTHTLSSDPHLSDWNPPS